MIFSTLPTILKLNRKHYVKMKVIIQLLYTETFSNRRPHTTKATGFHSELLYLHTYTRLCSCTKIKLAAVIKMRGRMRQGGHFSSSAKNTPNSRASAGAPQTASNHKTPVSRGKLNHSRVRRERKHKLVSRREHYRASLIISAV